MNGYQPHLQQIAAHQHQRIAAEFVREKFGMPVKAELFALHVLLADRSRNHRVDQAGFQVGGRSPERSDGSLAGRRAQHARSTRKSPNTQSTRLIRFGAASRADTTVLNPKFSAASICFL